MAVREMGETQNQERIILEKERRMSSVTCSEKYWKLTTEGLDKKRYWRLFLWRGEGRSWEYMGDVAWGREGSTFVMKAR